MAQVFIFGTGRGADTATRYFREDSAYDIVGYAVDRDFLTEPSFLGKDVVALEDLAAAFPPSEVLAFAPLGATRMNTVRAEKYAKLKALGYRFASYVHSSNSLNGRALVGENCFILENQSLNHDVVIGDNVVIWSGSQIGDRSRISGHAYIASHVVLNGDVEIGANAYLGSNCTISNGVRIGARCFIGANALITQNTAEGAVHIVEPTPAMDMDSMRFMRLMKSNL